MKQWMYQQNIFDGGSKETTNAPAMSVRKGESSTPGEKKEKKEMGKEELITLDLNLAARCVTLLYVMTKHAGT